MGRRRSSRRRRRTERRRRTAQGFLKVKKFEEDWSGNIDVTSFEKKVQLVDTKIMGASVQLMFKSALTTRFTSPSGDLEDLEMGETDFNPELQLIVMGSTIYTLTGKREPTIAKKDWLRKCWPVYFLQLCVTIGGKTEYSLAKVKLSAYATGSVSVYMAEAGIQAAGTFIETELKVTPTLTTKLPLTLCVHSTYSILPMRFQVKVVWRRKHFYYQRRRRWAGSAGYKFGSWRSVKTLYDKQFGGMSADVELFKVCKVIAP